ncbi:uncharacterized protein [Panulirus ornatus]|uniref:uncharacterized protein n=1 Tax=Panulirus ornatus TaxID=150431 RepID=UPI003A87DFEE
MAGDGLLSLRWNNHRTSFLQVLSSLKNKQTYSDVTLACAGKFYSVHKFVLSTCSDYFVEIMEKTPCKHPIIVLKDICHQDLEALLNYMYLGEVNVLQNELAGLIKAAECLRIKGLAVPDESPPPLPSGASQNSLSWDEGSPQTKRRKNEDDSANSNSSPPWKMNNSRPESEGPVETAASEDYINTNENSTRETAVANMLPAQEQQQVSTNEHNSEGSLPIPKDNQQEKNAEVENPDIKVEEEDVKYEDENGIHVPDTCSTLEVQMIESEGSSRGPVRNNEARLKYEPPNSGSAGGTPLRLPVTQHYSSHPQSFEEIVSQALPGPSGIQGDSGQTWDGNHSEGDMTPFHLRGFPQQEGLTPHHRGLQQMVSEVML